MKLYLSASNVIWPDEISSNSETNFATNFATNFVAFQISEDGRRYTSDLEKCNFKMRLQSAVASWNTLQISASKLNILNSLAAAATPHLLLQIQKSNFIHGNHVIFKLHVFTVTCSPQFVRCCHWPSLVPRLTWMSVGRTKPSRAGNFTSEDSSTENIACTPPCIIHNWILQHMDKAWTMTKLATVISSRS